MVDCYLLTLHTQQIRGLSCGSDLDIDEPRLHGIEALRHGDVVHQHHAVRLAKELLGDAAVPGARVRSSVFIDINSALSYNLFLKRNQSGFFLVS